MIIERTKEQLMVLETGYGVDVASLRADDLDKKILKNIADKDTPVILDLACGSGGQSRRMAVAGAMVTAVDVKDFSKQFDQLRLKFVLDQQQLNFYQADMRTVKENFGKHKYDFILMQRAIHYLPYHEALQLLVDVHSITKDRLYISVTGKETAIGAYHQGKDDLITKRFSCLSPVGQVAFKIFTPLCLYTKTEFLILLEQAGWQVEKCWVSAFGNIKVVARVGCKKAGERSSPA